MSMTGDDRTIGMKLKFQDFGKELTDSYKEDDLLTLFGSKAGLIDGNEACAFFCKMDKITRTPAKVVTSFEDRQLVNTFLDAPDADKKTAMHANDHVVQTKGVQWVTSPQMFRCYAKFNDEDEMLGCMNLRDPKMMQLHADIVATHNDMLIKLMTPDPGTNTIQQWYGHVDVASRRPTIQTAEYLLGEDKGNVMPAFSGSAPDMDFFADVGTRYRKKRAKPQYAMCTPTMAADIWKLNKEYFTRSNYKDTFCPAEELISLGKMLPFGNFKFIVTNELPDDKFIVFFTDSTFATTRWKTILDGGKNPEAHFRNIMMHEEHLDVFIPDPESLIWVKAA